MSNQATVDQSVKQRIRKNRFSSLKKYTTGELIFEIFNYTFLAIFTFICVAPFINQVAMTFSGNYAIRAGQVFLWPVDFHTDAFKQVVFDPVIFRAFMVTVYLTVFGTFLNMIMTISMAYPLSRRDLKGKVVIINMLLLTILFSGGMIPGFLLVKTLGMMNSLWSLLIPGLASAFNIFIMMTFFRGMPEEIRESAFMDGCGNMRYILQFVLPLSKASLATVGLFYAVGHWNTYMSAVLYIDDPSLYPLQVKLRNILLLSQMDTSIETLQSDYGLQVIEESLKSAVIVYSTLPILCVYPFLQKYFVKGVMIGSVKG